jgi:hypothetical protein
LPKVMQLLSDLGETHQNPLEGNMSQIFYFYLITSPVEYSAGIARGKSGLCGQVRHAGLGAWSR